MHFSILEWSPDSRDPHCLRLLETEECSFVSVVQAKSKLTPHHIDTKSLRSITRTREEETNDEMSIISAMDIYLQEK